MEQLSKPALAHWQEVVRCPACGSADSITHANLSDSGYQFGAEQVAYPEQGITIVECGACGLYYKSAVPAPAFLSDIFSRQAQAKWASSHDFLSEAALLRQLKGPKPFDLLDVGAADGKLLAACGAIAKRRSALDVIRYSGIDSHLSGEFIQGLLDQPLSPWSGEPYDVVTLFDVMEHLYEPEVAFENLRMLLRKNGLAFVETGNSTSFWPRRLGHQQWWYVRLIEHHVFWSRRSLERIAAAHGFRIAYWRNVRHKSRCSLPFSTSAIQMLKLGLYVTATPYYSSIAQRFGRRGNQPWFPYAVDHFQACLVKE